MKLEDYIISNRKPPALDEVVERINEISSLPQVAMQVMEVANDPNSTALDIKKAVEADPALSARILRCVNSSAFGLAEKVSSLQRAVAYIGMNQVRNLALSASVSELFAKDEAIGTYQRRGLWAHLVSVGICARLIAMRQGMEDFEDAFVAGLLHDIGIILEDQYVHDHFRRVIQNLRDGTLLVELEWQHLGFDHTQLGLRVAENWRFSEGVRAAIGSHHVSTNCPGPHAVLVRCVEVANLLCTLKGHTSVGRKLVAVSHPALNALSLTREHLAVLAQDLDKELAKNAALFGM